MSSNSRNTNTSRRACLQWMAVAALSPLVAQAECPCAQDDDRDPSKKAAPATPPTRAPATAPVAEPLKSLRVCADPNNLPFSNRNHAGFEDKIAAVVARELRLPLAFDWLPQRLGFYRTALKTFDSNMVMAAPAGFEKAMITRPYYRSSYVFISRRADKAPKRFDDPALRSLKIGVQLTGGDTPATHALAKQSLIDNVTGYPVFDESQGRPAERIVAAVSDGEIDLAIVWGPQAGYFVKQRPALEMSAIHSRSSEGDASAMPFEYEICMAIRRSNKDLLHQVNEIIARRQNEIDQILDTFAVPRLPLTHPTTRPVTDHP